MWENHWTDINGGVSNMHKQHQVGAPCRVVRGSYHWGTIWLWK
jgi:hypothetical protein